ncbi:MAG: nucleoside hydrolase [Clostridia bacterium]|nr:nucleoside hydrolase [Clostridia bacterium]
MVTDFTHYKKEVIITDQTKYKVILDTDTYNEADDQFAISYLLKSKDIFDIEAITIAPFKHEMYKKTVSDSIDDSYNEACKIYDLLGIDNKANIYKGSRGYLVNGYNGNNDAVTKIVEIANNNKKTYILSIGCLTNIALAIKNNPEIINKIEVIWLGSNFLYGLNQDFNFTQDVDAVRIVFESEVKLTVMPCSPITSNLMTSIYELKAEIGGKNTLCDYLCNIFYNRSFGPTKRWPLWDISVIAYMINKDWFNTMDVSCPIINDDNTFKLIENKHKITFVNYINANAIFNDLFNKLIK